ncbi:TonB-dependent receptor [Robiginitalea sp.]|uniref:TonB-dependent receptor n=1 Tax=Robiginitalea sp. TaxID=1902411 RepID=UPI003C62C025
MKFFLKVFTFVFLEFFWVTCGLNAQQVGIYDRDTGEPISDVAVFTQDRSVTALTDFDGQFDLGNFPERVRIEIRHLAYQTRILYPDGIRQMGGRILLVSKPEQLQEIVVSISKWEQQKRDIPQKIETINAEAVALGNPQTSADLLQQSGKVFVQKSQYGGGSPMIRGFATNRVLLAVDGVRMNNAIFRGGNIQNIISIDPFAVKNVEVLFGPGSVIYGSDAIGGVMNFYTKSPRFSRSDSLEFNANAGYRTSSASNEQTLHGDFALSGEKWATLTSLTYNSFGDLKMGLHGPESYLRPGYVVTRNGQDEFKANEDPRTQVPTGYHQWSLMQKVGYRPDNNWSFDLGLHYSQTSDVPRYDRLIRPAENEAGLRSAEWEYGPQIWGMGNLLVSHKGTEAFYDRVKLSVAYQFFEEGRRDRNFQDPIRFITEEQVDAYSLNLDFENGKIGNFNLFYGAEYVLNQVNSAGSEENVRTGEQSAGPSRYPDDSLWMSLAAYINSTYRLKPNLSLLAGLRYSHFWINADFVQDFYPFPFEDARLDNGAFTGSLGVSWFPYEDTQITTNLSTGFRAPNIDDIGKVFDSEPGAVVVPNPDLEPEYAYNFEIGVRQNFGDKLVVRGSAYYTYLSNAMVRRDYTFNETDTIVYNGVPSKVQAIQNASKAFVYGVEFGFDASLHEFWGLSGNLTLAEGEEEEADGRTTAARHVAPTFGNLELSWDKYPWQAGVFLNYNGEIPFEDLALSERAKPFIYAEDANGNPYSPSWYTLNLRASYTLWDRYQFTFALENLTNQRYRTYSSGIAAAGFNVIAGFNVRI